MSHSLFISDLHLSPDHPQSTELFLRFATGIAHEAEALYILGDLFEYWAGDDDLNDPFHRRITDALRGLDARGTHIYIMHGNRDFLMDAELGAACHATLLNDPTLLDLYGTPTLLTHGDALCTDDTEYQRFREQVRKDDWQARFLAQPLAQRKAQIEQMRMQSKNEKRLKAMDIMDVNVAAVDNLLREHRYPRVIHGHTHRPAKHLHHPDGHTCERWVLGDWDSGKAAILRGDAHGLEWMNI
ncbi:UDP-2,3-diacylglucosamine diphosphatase [Sideroxydans sp. CL21]|uniref:UDP-2,3-diacylglucosamine diphosphatase n=1 Tax=Sideroxydans sp. CL21 TaxID=2600596 RepID=UPI0024BC1D42|nr:UDP-2,3-diacylglucosamine diphosphatase [Sideroxydans sp. CL21]